MITLCVLVSFTTPSTSSPAFACLRCMTKSLTVVSPHWLQYIFSYIYIINFRNPTVAFFGSTSSSDSSTMPSLSFLTPSQVICNRRTPFSVPPLRLTLISSIGTPVGSPQITPLLHLLPFPLRLVLTTLNHLISFILSAHILCSSFLQTINKFPFKTFAMCMSPVWFLHTVVNFMGLIDDSPPSSPNLNMIFNSNLSLSLSPIPLPSTPRTLTVFDLASSA